MNPNPKTTELLPVRSKSPSQPLGLESGKLRPELRTAFKALQYYKVLLVYRKFQFSTLCPTPSPLSWSTHYMRSAVRK